ncbi:hypothetical protein CEXT_772191, partial [Caerostris extrusa]
LKSPLNTLNQEVGVFRLLVFGCSGMVGRGDGDITSLLAASAASWIEAPWLS